MESSTAGNLRRRRRRRLLRRLPSLSLSLSTHLSSLFLHNHHHQLAGISRDSLHKRRATGAGPKKFRKKRK